MRGLKPSSAISCRVIVLLLLLFFGLKLSASVTNDHAKDYMITVNADDLTCHFNVKSYPFSVDVKIDGKSYSTPYQAWVAYGKLVSIEAESTVDVGGKTYVFNHWIESDHYDFYSSGSFGRVITYQMPSRLSSTLEAVYVTQSDVPWYSQDTDKYCGPATVEMMFDYHGPDISQSEVAAVAETGVDGTYTNYLRRACHFSSLSSKGGLNGYTARNLGYAAFEYQPGSPWLGNLKSLIDAGCPIIVLMRYNSSARDDQGHPLMHYRVAVAYNDSDNTIRLHDPWDPELYGSGKCGGPFLPMSYDVFSMCWSYSNYWGLFVSPWKVQMEVPKSVAKGDHFSVNATVTYPCPDPFPRGNYLASSTKLSLTLPSGFSLENEESGTVQPEYLRAGESAKASWHVVASSLDGNYTFTITGAGTVSDSNPYVYSDRIGGVNSSTIEVTSQIMHGVNVSLDSLPNCVPPGAFMNFTVYVTNTGNVRDDFAISILGLQSSWYNCPSHVTLESLATNPVMISVSLPLDTSVADYSINFTAMCIVNPSVTHSSFSILRVRLMNGHSEIVFQTESPAEAKNVETSIYSPLQFLTFAPLFPFGIFSKRRKYLLLIMVVVTVSVAFGVALNSIIISNIGRIVYSVCAYTDPQCSNRTLAIDWAPMKARSSQNVTLYLRNERESTFTLSLSASDWNPLEASGNMVFSWNYSGTALKPKDVVNVAFTINTSSYISNIEAFNFNIKISATT